MIKCKVLTSKSGVELEEQINGLIHSAKKEDIIRIEYSVAMTENTDGDSYVRHEELYSALMIYEDETN